MPHSGFQVEEQQGVWVLRLQSDDGTNRLTRKCIQSLTHEFGALASNRRPLVIAGNDRFFSAGADLKEIFQLTGPEALAFAKMGQGLMEMIDLFPAPVYVAISGYCMGGGLDLALACRHRIASPYAMFGHRGAALGLITGWGGTQRLPRLIGKGRALECSWRQKKSPPHTRCEWDWWTRLPSIQWRRRCGAFAELLLRSNIRAK
jgi:enoyl-CoA hydratase/carnithine racemase